MSAAVQAHMKVVELYNILGADAQGTYSIDSSCRRLAVRFLNETTVAVKRWSQLSSVKCNGRLRMVWIEDPYLFIITLMEECMELVDRSIDGHDNDVIIINIIITQLSHHHFYHSLTHHPLIHHSSHHHSLVHPLTHHHSSLPIITHHLLIIPHHYPSSTHHYPSSLITTHWWWNSLTTGDPRRSVAPLVSRSRGLLPRCAHSDLQAKGRHLLSRWLIDYFYR